tara:strand:+ start:21 stop:401 length:381 start_codon:yes stop_codon:yes gene_type:complete
MRLNKSSNKSFGILFFLVFFLIGLWPLLNGENIRVWAIIISLIFLLLGLLDSKILSPLNNSWIRLGEVLGRIISPLVMALIYFVILTPLSFIIRLSGKDLLKLKFSKDNSYWIARDKSVGSMKKQF